MMRLTMNQQLWATLVAKFEQLQSIASSSSTMLLVGLFGTTFIFLLNLAITLWIIIQRGVASNLGDLYTDSCQSMKTINVVAHLFINICSSLVLSTSNFCAQYMVAPTRGEVSRAHAKGDWLEIGASSFRNLLGNRIDIRRKLVFLGIFLGSMPLHLLWNSVFFSTIPVTSYQVMLVTNDFLSDPEPWNTTFISDGLYWFDTNGTHSGAEHTDILQQKAYGSKLERLSRESCIERYLESGARHKDVIVVAANVSMSDNSSFVPENPQSSLLYLFKTIHTGPTWMWGSDWLCSAFTQGRYYGWSSGLRWCSKDFLLPHENEWALQIKRIEPDYSVSTRFFAKIDYCLSAGVERTEGGCAIRYSLVLLITLTALNAFLLLCNYFVWSMHCSRTKLFESGQWQHEQLVSIDTSIASFLRHRDEHTAGLTFLEYTDCKGNEDFRRLAGDQVSNSRFDRLGFGVRWYHAIDWPLRVVTSISLLVAVCACVVLLCKILGALRNYRLSTTLASLWNMGFGEVHDYAIALTGAWRSLGGASFYATMMLVNAPQVVMGCCWFLGNSILTRFMLAHRWAQLITKRAGLRVPTPEGHQRSAYFLSLPYRYSIPLLIFSTLAHWLLSQVIFVVQTRGFTYDISLEDGPGFQCAWLC
ncbi:hypothetical protein F4780DRAFT_430810 [Xylariomycetidae sp. FL0641]|nr:hypothetical protein F4780DRAFT_430810 [Xylariomycetidae sp. FL0641]